jgi:hypothetical protein
MAALLISGIARAALTDAFFCRLTAGQPGSVPGNLVIYG